MRKKEKVSVNRIYHLENQILQWALYQAEPQLRLSTLYGLTICFCLLVLLITSLENLVFTHHKGLQADFFLGTWLFLALDIVLWMLTKIWVKKRLARNFLSSFFPWLYLCHFLGLFYFSSLYFDHYFLVFLATLVYIPLYHLLITCYQLSFLSSFRRENRGELLTKFLLPSVILMVFFLFLAGGDRRHAPTNPLAFYLAGLHFFLLFNQLLLPLFLFSSLTFRKKGQTFIKENPLFPTFVAMSRKKK